MKEKTKCESTNNPDPDKRCCLHVRRNPSTGQPDSVCCWCGEWESTKHGPYL